MPGPTDEPSAWTSRITRCSNNYGPHQFPEKVIPLFVTNLIDGLQVPLYGDGRNMRDWLHVDDHCRGINLVLTKGRAGEIYNIGGGTELTNRELTASAGRRRWVPARRRSGGSRTARATTCATRWTSPRSPTSWATPPRWPFERGLAETIAWYRDNEAWWRPLKEAKPAL